MKKKLLIAGLLPVMTVVEASEKPNILVIMTDDWGSGDLSLYGALDDIKTPHIDQLAKEGVLFTDGYITSPQCAPSRVGLLTGRYQQRLGLDNILDGPLDPSKITIADRLKTAGYTTGMVGKWHLEPNAATLGWAIKHHPEIIENNRIVRLPFELMEPYFPHHYGFDFYYYGTQSPYYMNFDRSGSDVHPPRMKATETHRVDAKTEAAVAFIKRSKNEPNPYFLYLAYYAPHVPLNATQEYLDRFPGEMPERRRQGLALMSAIDDGVGEIIKALKDNNQYENTLVFFLSDNGAPLGVHQGKSMEDVLPVDKPGPAWNGSRNDPFLGEKGMLSEGGIRIPFIASWPGTIPAGQRFEHPVISLDIAATANALAGLPSDPQLDGVNLIPYLTGEKQGAPHEQLFFKFWNQAAIRSGDWKLIQAGARRQLLFNLRDDKEETTNLISEHPELAQTLHQKLEEWSKELVPPGMPSSTGNDQEVIWFDHYYGRGETRNKQ
jgi:arylsulfatase A-like enzyme